MSDRLHKTARVAAVAGAVGSVALTLYAGRNNNLPLLMVLMAGWVVAPFVWFALASLISHRWSEPARAALDIRILLMAFLPLTSYPLKPPGPANAKPATVYFAVSII